MAEDTGEVVTGTKTREKKPEFIRKLEKTRVKARGTKSRGDQLPAQLPIWPESRRGMPNTFLRSALFGCLRYNDDRVHFNDVELASTADIKLSFTGLQLSQDDEDVYMEIIHRSRFTPLGEIVTFSGYELLKSLGWGTSSRDYKRMQNSIHRLKSATLKLVHESTKGYAGSLIRKYSFKEMSADGRVKYSVWLEPELVSQFQDDSYTQLKFEQRQKLGRAGLAKWLHSYLSTHSSPFGLKTETIRTLSSSDTKRLSKFRSQCKEAHEKLIDVGLLKSYHYDSRTDIFLAIRA